MRGFAGKIESVGPIGEHLRYVPGELARSMVEANVAEIHNQNGKVRAIRLTQSADTHAQRVGPPS